MGTPLVWLVAAQAAGLVAADLAWLTADWALVLALLSLQGALVSRRQPRLRLLCCAALVFGASAVALAARLEQAARLPPGPAAGVTLDARVAERRAAATGVAVVLDEVRAVDAAALPGRIQLWHEPAGAPWPPFESVAVGDRVRARVRLRRPLDRVNPGGQQRARGLARRGIGAEGRLAHPSLHVRWAQADRWDVLRPLRAWRQRLVAGLAAGDASGLLRGLALGERAGVSTHLRDALSRLGLAHLLAVSGLHLALVAAAGFGLARRALVRSGLAARRDPRLPALLVALVLAGAYAWLAGFGVPVRRAWLLLLCLALAVLRGRGTRPLAGLGLAWLVLLAVDPAALFAAGPQLSFAATAALLAARRLPTTREGSWSPGDWLSSSALALVATAPIAAWHLGVAAPVGLVLNLLAIPWTACALLPAAFLALAATSLAPCWPGAMVLLGLADGLATASALAVLQLAEWFDVPSAVARPGPWAMALAGLCLGVALWRPSWRVRVVAAAVASSAPLWLPVPRQEPEPPRLVALDVGQGDALLVQGRRAAVLVDAGSARPGRPGQGRRSVVPALHALGVSRLDVVVASHADLDHRGGLPAVVAGIPVGAVWLPPGGRRDPLFAALRRVAARRGVALRERGLGSPIYAVGDLTLLALWPPRDGKRSRNDGSLVVRVETAGRRVLLPGDVSARAERGLLTGGPDLHADVLVLPHHGSRSSSSSAWLAAVSPQVAVASAPCAGRFAMPHPEVEARLRSAGIPLWWTGRDGAVAVGLGATTWVRGWRGAPLASAACRISR